MTWLLLAAYLAISTFLERAFGEWGKPKYVPGMWFFWPLILPVLAAFVVVLFPVFTIIGWADAFRPWFDKQVKRIKNG